MSVPHGGGSHHGSESHGPGILEAAGEGAANFLDQMAEHVIKIGGGVDMAGGGGYGGGGGHEHKSHGSGHGHGH